MSSLRWSPCLRRTTNTLLNTKTNSNTNTCINNNSNNNRQFSSTPCTQGTRKKVMRQVNKQKQKLWEDRKVAYQRSRPHPALGHHPDTPQVYDKSPLAQLALDPQAVWQSSASAEDKDYNPTLLDAPSTINPKKVQDKKFLVGQGRSSLALEQDKFRSFIQSKYTEQNLPKNFGLDNDTFNLVTKVLPQVTLARSATFTIPSDSSSSSSSSTSTTTTTSSSSTSGFVNDSKLEQMATEEENKTEQLKRIISLTNANTKQIRMANNQLIIKEFGRPLDNGRKDSGSLLVQAATLTLRIRNLHAHTVAQPKDKTSIQKLLTLCHRRQRIFRHARRHDPQEYSKALEICGIDPRAIEDEISMPKPKTLLL